MGRLSKPPDAINTIVEQGRSERRRPPRASQPPAAPDATPRRAEPQEKRGRLSNPVLRRLTDAEIKQMIQQYRAGASIETLVRRYEVHRTTVMAHLERAGNARPRMVRKMTDQSVAVAAARYEAGASLPVVASAFGVHDRTLAREFRRAQVPIRPRRGWHC